MRSDAGFTLIEALVAMAVLAVGAIALLGAVERHVRLADGLIDRTAARWAAENRLSELSLGLAPDAGRSSMLGRAWRVVDESRATADPDLLRIDVSVYGPDQRSDADPVARLTGFVDVGGARPGAGR